MAAMKTPKRETGSGDAEDRGPTTQGDEASLEDVIRDHLRRIEGMAFAASVSLPILGLVNRDAVSRLDEEKFEEIDGLLAEADEDEDGRIVPDHVGRRIASALEERDRELRHSARTTEGLRSVLETFVVALVSHFGGFVEQALEAQYRARPKLMSGVRVDVGVGELVGEGRDHIGPLAREVARLSCGKGYAEVMNEACARHKFKHPRDAVAGPWQVVEEVIARRHVLVHRRGLADESYRKRMGRRAACQVGDRLAVNVEYLNNALLAFYGVACAFGIGLWITTTSRKEEDQADDVFGFVVDESKRLLEDGLEGFAVALVGAADNWMDRTSAENTANALLNLACALKRLGRVEEAVSVLARLKGLPGRELGPRHRLARKVVLGDYKAAAHELKKSDDLEIDELLDWPIFAEFRRQPVFVGAFKARFGETPDAARARRANRTAPESEQVG